MRCAPDRLEPVWRIGTIERVVCERPAGERGGVAMHDPDAQAADIGDQVHGQCGECVGRAR